MDTSSQESTEETIFTGDDLMTNTPSPLIPADLSSKILDGVELCSSHLRKLFEYRKLLKARQPHMVLPNSSGLHKNDIEPFCQDEIVIYLRCSQRRDTLLRNSIYLAEETLGRALPDDHFQERVAKLQSNATLLERRFLLASGLEGVEGFRQRWSLNGQLQDLRKRIEYLEKGVASKRKESEPPPPPPQRAWWHIW